MPEATEKRLTRIEEKLDKVSETLTQLARIDERQSGFETRLNRHEKRLDLIEDDVRVTDTALAKMAGKGLLFERGAWIVFAAVLSLATGKFL